MLTESPRTFLGLLALTLLMACSTPRPDPDPGPRPTPGPGDLAIVVSDLPPGLPAAIQVTGPNAYLAVVRQSQTLSGLVPGDYSVSAGSLTSGSLTYFPHAGLQRAQVVSGATTALTVSYTAMPFGLGIEEVTNVGGAVFLTAPPGDRRLFVVERAGRIHLVDNGVRLSVPFLDINDRVLSRGEGGLLSMAFDPNFASNGYFYLYYTDNLRRIVVERQRVSADPNRADPDSALAIIRVFHLNDTHYGGTVAFGPDGYLYLATGDDGGTGDPFRNGQNLHRLLAKVLRLDVSTTSEAQRYRIPPSNPFVGRTGHDEIWALGLRNPWRFSFDNNLLYLADVGQDRREEVNVVNVGPGGYNFGWNIMEGSLCYNATSCNQAGLTLPVQEYDHGNGCSVTGGYVYRGGAIAGLTGHYLYSDFCRGFLRSFRYSGDGITDRVDWLIPGAGNVQSFGRGGDGELYLVASNGKIFRIVQQGIASAAR